MFDWPPEFDPAWYRAQHPALACADDAAVEADWRTRGAGEGRPGSPMALREHLLAAIGDERTILEIGPFYSPMKSGPLVHYIDVLDADALRARAARSNKNAAGVPEVIHHVGPLETVADRYDVVLGSHSIEHQPDLVAHLRAAEAVLNPGGAYVLIVPDKRYCFDHHIPESTIAGVLQAWEEKRARHTLASVIEHRALTVHNNALRHWAGENGNRLRDRNARVAAAIAEYEAAEGGYIDVHAWYFTPDNFREIVATLNALGLAGLRPVRVYGAVRDRNEFCAILQRV